ncbi:hypothetical protein [Natronocella acetinitrilica]|nr:hypothetical protein [Natronocella acetinitrilica]
MDALDGARLSLTREKRTQAEIGDLLERAGLAARREVVLDAVSVIDFLVGDECEAGVGIEVKLRAPRMAIYRQLERYAASPAIGGLLLVSNTAISLPGTIGGKPARVLSLGAGWL